MKNQKNLLLPNWPKQKESNFIAFENYSDNNNIKIKHQEKIALNICTRLVYIYVLYILRVNTADGHGMEEAQDIIIIIST
jgi:hypothetical protein